jgi:hypothetical protein
LQGLQQNINRGWLVVFSGWFLVKKDDNFYVK